MASGPCGFEFREAFSCFHYSKADPKGSDCVEKFGQMQECMNKYPNLYPAKDDEEDEEEDAENPFAQLSELDVDEKEKVKSESEPVSSTTGTVLNT